MNPCTRICSPLPRLSATPPSGINPSVGVERLLRADDEIRTRDPHLGKVMLYQLSHVRMLRLTGARNNLAHIQAAIQILGCLTRGVARSGSGGEQEQTGLTRQGRHALTLLFARVIGAVVARFVHTEEVTGSNPVSPTVANTV